MSEAPLRIHQTRSRANPGGMDVSTVLGSESEPFRGRKPSWFKVPLPGSPKYRELNKMIEAESLHTVCQEAACPNIGECWERGTATFMILGDTCTRRCGFCNVKTGKPTWNDPLEPEGRWEDVRAKVVEQTVAANQATDGSVLLEPEYLLSVIELPG